MTAITIRRARPDDAPSARALVFASGPRYLNHVFGLGVDEARALGVRRGGLSPPFGAAQPPLRVGGRQGRACDRDERRHGLPGSLAMVRVFY